MQNVISTWVAWANAQFVSSMASFLVFLFTFGVRRSRGEMWLCVCLCICLSLAAFPVYHTTGRTRGCNRGMMGCPLVVHYWAYLQSVHGFRCYDNVALNAKCQQVWWWSSNLSVLWNSTYSKTYISGMSQLARHSWKILHDVFCHRLPVFRAVPMQPFVNPSDAKKCGPQYLPECKAWAL